jgi:Xaa-Pro aminopeptidase
LILESQFQSFEEQGSSAQSAIRIAELRHEMASRGLSGWLVPRADEHQNEYVPANAERLLWLTGFSGSAGLVVVLQDEAALFVDGRYTLQAPAQVDTALVAVKNVVEESPIAWLRSRLKPGGKLAYDPWLHTPDSLKPYAALCAEAGAQLVASPANLIDMIWRDRPRAPAMPVVPRSARYAGESAASKLKRIRAGLAAADGVLLSDAHNVAWTFNLRGSDIAHTPLALAFAYVPREGKAVVFLGPDRLTATALKGLEKVAELRPFAALEPMLADLGNAKARLAFDAGTAPAKLVQTFESHGGTANVQADVVTSMKAQKNAAELAGSREAHQLDGIALVRFLHWFDEAAENGAITEIDAALVLENFRRETGALKELSFPTISAAGPHAAMPHYRVTNSSDLKIAKGFYLVDSGAQYEAGTTDITRTIVVGKASREMRDRFTRVLKGHIAIARAVFPKGVNGAQIDAFARNALWQAGLDFDHGTGHGVGVYLSVHEGPQRIAKSGFTPLLPGMIISNEPGYYAAGRYGIRTENLVVVEPRTIPGAEREMLGFETISFTPIDRRAIEPQLLSSEERAWVDAYHKETRARVAPHVTGKTLKWLRQATAPL